MSAAPVHIGQGSHSPIIDEFYSRSGRESIGPGLLETEPTPRRFASLVDLLDHLLESAESTHVVVNHGSPQQGLLIPFTATSPHNATGLVARSLAALVDAISSGTVPAFDPNLLSLAAQMGVGPGDVLALLDRFARIRRRNLVLHFRGCNLGRDAGLLGGYKILFGAALITAPTCRMFYLRVRPHQPAAGTSLQQLASQQPHTPRTRRRMFSDPSGRSGPLVVDVRDIDGHTRVDTDSFMDAPARVHVMGEMLTGRWTGTTPDFVLPVLWDDAEVSYHTPLEPGYRQRLSFV